MKQKGLIKTEIERERVSHKRYHKVMDTLIMVTLKNQKKKV